MLSCVSYEYFSFFSDKMDSGEMEQARKAEVRK
jgi:hypothetical protein